MSELVHEVAAPGSVFWETVRHPENVEILEGDEKTRKLPPDKLKLAQQKIALLQPALNVYFAAYVDHLTGRIEHINRQLPALSPDRAAAAGVLIAAMQKRIEQVKQRMTNEKPSRKNPYVIKTAKQAKEAMTTIHRLQARIAEHRRAIENEALNRRLQDEMQMEISFYANQIIDRWTALGYREEIYIDGKRKLRKVHFEEAHFTEDNIQFKIAVTSLTLLESTHHHLPDKVKAWDLVKEETLRELEAACECPVTSPHVDENQGFEKGAWVIVHRVGMRDGLFNYIELNRVLAKYNQALRPRFALPVGVKAGRKIEYLYLDQVPHLMMNGITGSGKTNAARVFLATLGQFYSPDEVRFVLVDLKRSGDLNFFAHVPHLIGDVIKDIDALTQLMPKLVALMHQRMLTLSAANCVDIIEYNSRVEPDERMERIIVLVDECGSIGDLAQNKDQRETIYRCLTLLAAQARAAGLQLMLGTQQPSKEAIPSRITNNITYTLSARQRTTSGAMSALGNNRLKALPAIKGRMLVDNGFGLFPVQTPYATLEDILKAVEIAKDYPAPRPLVLPGDEDTEAALQAVEASVPQPVTRERIIEYALQHDGVPSAHRIYEQSKGVTPRQTILNIIKALAAEKEFCHDGINYQINPVGRGYRITPLDGPKTEIPNDGVSHTGISAVETTVEDAVLEDALS